MVVITPTNSPPIDGYTPNNIISIISMGFPDNQSINLKKPKKTGKKNKGNIDNTNINLKFFFTDQKTKRKIIIYPPFFLVHN